MTEALNAASVSHEGSPGRGAEFDAIAHLVARLGSRAKGIGDDAAIVQVPRGDVVVASVDAFVEGRHFLRDWVEPRDVGYRATSAALSDLAAMGAWPTGILVALCIPESWRPALEGIADGIAEAVTASDTFVLGGNMSAASEFSITTTVLGHAFRPLRRAGAAAGESVYVTGALGGPHRAIATWNRGETPDQQHHERFVRPRPRLAEARWLAEHGATSAIDISDGLVADLGHLADASGVVADIDLDLVPVVDGVNAVDAAMSGEEYELIITSAREVSTADFTTRFGLRLTRIGRMRAGPSGVVVTAQGNRIELAGGYDHFHR